MIETKMNEVIFTTSDPKKMLNHYIVKCVNRTWNEDFLDESTGDVVTIERNEVLFKRGTLIDNDILTEIQFYMQAGEVKDIEVSNQKRVAYQLESNYLHPFTAQAEINDRKYKFLFYASKIDTALLILKDYIELNFRDPFMLTMIKEFDSCIILTDQLKEHKISDRPIDQSCSLFDEEADAYSDDADLSDIQKKFYQIEVNIEYQDDFKTSQTFVVHTFNVDRAMMLINHYLAKQEEKKEKEARKNNLEYEKSDFRTMIELAKTIPVGIFIPYQFSQVYANAE